MHRFIGILGIFAILGLAYLLSNNKKKIGKKLILWGISLQIFFAVLILKIPGGTWIFDKIGIIMIEKIGKVDLKYFTYTEIKSFIGSYNEYISH